MRYKIYVFQTFFVFSITATHIRPSEVVNLKNPKSGKIRGKTYTFEDGREASAFLGIPYAKPPIGDLRFKRPKRIESWIGIKEMTKFGNRCYYTTSKDYGISPSENCLFINVFVPGSSFGNSNKTYPIAFYIHGGAFQTDNAQLLGDENICRYLALKDVIVVTFNYRLQFFGFLAIDEHTPGNLGLWDMKMALEWIRDNAVSFGGDSSRITGSIATDLLSLSPQTRDLFDQAIMFSGTKYVFSGISDIPTLRANAIIFAETAGFKTIPGLPKKVENRLLMNFFNTAPPENITIGWESHPRPIREAFVTSPSLDNEFFPKPLDELRKEAPRKRTITGVTEYEALLFLMSKPDDTPIYDYTKTFLTGGSLFHAQINNTVAEIIIKSFVDMSLPRDSIEFYKQCATLLSDFIFNYPTWKMINARVELGETAYIYNLTYFKSGTLGSATSLPFKAATHTLELPFVFGKSILVWNFIPNERDKQKIEEVTTMLTNFIKTGNSGEKWLPYDLKNQNYYWFGQNSVNDGMKNNFGAGRMLKWEQLYLKYGVKC